VGVKAGVLAFAAVVSLGIALPASAGGRWTTFYPLGKAASVDLPVTWQNVAPPSGESFEANSPLNAANLQVTVNPYSGSFASWVAASTKGARLIYHEQDPNAKVQSGVVHLPAGRAFHVLAHLNRTANGKLYGLVVDVYAFLRGGQYVQFIYLTYVPYASEYLPIFAASGRSVRFH
jgi:hypothetical protein